MSEEVITRIYVKRTDPVEFYTEPETLTGRVIVYLPPIPVRLADDLELEGLSLVYNHFPVLTEFDLGDLSMSASTFLGAITRAQQFMREIHSMCVAVAALPYADGVVEKLDLRSVLNGKGIAVPPGGHPSGEGG
jgi:hypothetical protein